MNVMTAVKEKENYEKIVSWFQSQGTLTVDQLVLLIDVIEAMSEEIFEYYKRLQDICRLEIKTIKERKQDVGSYHTFLTDSEQHQLAYVIEKACRMRVLLSEKYEDMIRELRE